MTEKIIKSIKFNDIPNIYFISTIKELEEEGLRYDLWGDKNEKNINQLLGIAYVKKCVLLCKNLKKSIHNKSITIMPNLSTDIAVLKMYGIKIWSDYISENIPIHISTTTSTPIHNSITVVSNLSNLSKNNINYESESETDSDSDSDLGSDYDIYSGSDSDSDIKYKSNYSIDLDLIYGSSWELEI